MKTLTLNFRLEILFKTIYKNDSKLVLDLTHIPGMHFLIYLKCLCTFIFNKLYKCELVVVY